MPKQTIAIFAIIGGLACALIGFLAGALLYENQINQSGGASNLQIFGTIISAVGITAAIAIAVFTELRITKRFEDQVDVQIKLDKRADERLQAAWEQTTKDRRLAEDRFQETAFQALIFELNDYLQSLTSYYHGLRDVQNEHPAAEPIRPFTAKRSVFPSLSARIFELPPKMIKDITSYETMVHVAEAALKETSITFKGDCDELMWRIIELFSTTAYYLAALQTNARPIPQEAVLMVTEHLGLGRDEVSYLLNEELQV